MSLYGRLPTAFNRKLAKSRGGNEPCLLSVASLKGKRKMKNANKAWPMLPALVLLTACSMGDMRAGTGTHLSAMECRDLTEIKHKAPVTHERNMSEVAALEKAGYHPGSFNDDPYYPG